MSIKIYNGRRYVGNIEKFQQDLFSLKSNKKLIELLTKKVNDVISADQLDLEDGLIKHSHDGIFTPSRFTRCFSNFICNNIDDKKFKFLENVESNHHFWFINRYNRLSINISFRVIKRKIYCIIDCYDEEIINLITKELNLEEYSYWNNVDKPDNISYQAWNRRAKVWKEDWSLCFKYNVFDFSKHFNLFNLNQKIID